MRISRCRIVRDEENVGEIRENEFEKKNKYESEGTIAGEYVGVRGQKVSHLCVGKMDMAPNGLFMQL